MEQIVKIISFVVLFFLINYLLIFFIYNVDPFIHMGDYQWTLITSIASSFLITNFVVLRIFKNKK
ncbi:MAG: hypothetical protein CMP51_04190 [Flavobacteriales bacterium]|nr:hypothetical protein [Flavobacteriales bacterium]